MSAPTASATQTQTNTPKDPTPAAPQVTEKPKNFGPNKRIHIRRLPFETTRAELEELCSSYGRVTTVDYCRRGYGLVTFETADDAAYAIYRLKEKVWHGMELSADWSSPQQPKSNQTGNQKKEEKEATRRNKKAELSLKYLTPRNPATPNPTGNATQRASGTAQANEQSQQAPQQQDQGQPGQASSQGQSQGNAGSRRNRGGNRGRGGRGGGRGGGGGGRGRRGGGPGRNGRNNDADLSDNQQVSQAPAPPNSNSSADPVPSSAPSSPSSAVAPSSSPASSSPAPIAAGVSGNAGNTGNNANSYNGGNRRNRKPRGGAKGKKNGGLFEITVKNLDDGSVTHTLHMTEVEVQQYIAPLTKEKPKNSTTL